jgi:hypothetical protein
MMRRTISPQSVHLRRRAFEDELVVDLEEHLRTQSALRELGVDAVHGDFDDVGGGALHGHVDAMLGGGADIGLLALIRDVASTPHHCLGVAPGARLRDNRSRQSLTRL